MASDCEGLVGVCVCVCVGVCVCGCGCGCVCVCVKSDGFGLLGFDWKMALPGGHVAAAAIFGTIACLLGLAAFLYLFRYRQSL